MNKFVSIVKIAMQLLFIYDTNPHTKIKFEGNKGIIDLIQDVPLGYDVV